MRQTPSVVAGRDIAEFTLWKLVCHVLELAIYEEVVLSNKVATREVTNNNVDSSAPRIQSLDLLAECFVEEALIDCVAHVVRNVLFILI